MTTVTHEVKAPPRASNEPMTGRDLVTGWPYTLTFARPGKINHDILRVKLPPNGDYRRGHVTSGVLSLAAARKLPAVGIDYASFVLFTEPGKLTAEDCAAFARIVGESVLPLRMRRWRAFRRWLAQLIAPHDAV